MRQQYRPRRKSRIDYLLDKRVTGKAWNILRDAVRNKTYKKSLIIYPANVDENEVYIPTTSIQSTHLDPLTHATQINSMQHINDYENINIGDPIRIGVVEGNEKKNRSLLSHITSTLMRKPQLPTIQPIPVERSALDSLIPKKKGGSKLLKQIFSKRKKKHIRKTYKKKNYKIKN